MSPRKLQAVVNFIPFLVVMHIPEQYVCNLDGREMAAEHLVL